MIWRGDNQQPEDSYASSEDYYSAVRKSLRSKADHNKNESQLCFSLAITCTLASPLFVTLGHGDLFAKIVPATLSVIAAALSSWLQLRKPQRLWAIYRRAQRELEREKSHFDFKLGEYGVTTDPEILLAERVSDIVFKVHERWEGLVPEVEALGNHIAPLGRGADDRN
ncbi:DUF4231 domain-containing protein [Rhizobium leguminosarum]|uniref:DUF4231 domain-containing protein n=1 Tax=Rhizobium leguminosarum TaxID=384 RepID=UPI003F9C545B